MKRGDAQHIGMKALLTFHELPAPVSGLPSSQAVPSKVGGFGGQRII